MTPGARGDERGRSEPTDGKNSKSLQIRVSWAFSAVLVLGGGKWGMEEVGVHSHPAARWDTRDLDPDVLMLKNSCNRRRKWNWL